jgi:hypothetical protein
VSTLNSCYYKFEICPFTTYVQFLQFLCWEHLYNMVSTGKVRANDRLPLARATSVHCLSEASCITHKGRHGERELGLHLVPI